MRFSFVSSNTYFIKRLAAHNKLSVSRDAAADTQDRSQILKQACHRDVQLLGNGEERIERDPLDRSGVVGLDLTDKADAAPDRLGKLLLGQAAELAELAVKYDDVPVGCVIVRDGSILAGDCNSKEFFRNPVNHAEMNAIGKASEELGGWRLTRCELYVTLEPCPMCAGAIWAARIPRVVIGAKDPKHGAYGSVLDMNGYNLNHMPDVVFGVMEDECSQLLKDFFAFKRNKKEDSSAGDEESAT